MRKIVYEKLDSIDLEKVRKLLADNDLPHEDIDSHVSSFYIAKTDDKLIGVAGLEIYDKYALFRSLVVDSEYRNMGIGKILFQMTIDRAYIEQIDTMYLLTLTADKYFEKLECISENRENVPTEISNTLEFKSLCPVCAKCYRYDIQSAFHLKDLPTYCARLYLIEHMHCSESILNAYNRALYLGVNNAGLKMASGFGLGIGGYGCCCGALLSTVLVLGALEGRTSGQENDADMRKHAYEMAKSFKEKNKFTCCRLLNVKDKYKQERQRALCGGYIKSACEILNEILKKYGILEGDI